MFAVFSAAFHRALVVPRLADMIGVCWTIVVDWSDLALLNQDLHGFVGRRAAAISDKPLSVNGLINLAVWSAGFQNVIKLVSIKPRFWHCLAAGWADVLHVMVNPVPVAKSMACHHFVISSARLAQLLFLVIYERQAARFAIPHKVYGRRLLIVLSFLPVRSAFSNFIVLVVIWGARKEVPGIYARRVVALVASIMAIRERAVGCFIGKPMSIYGFGLPTARW